MNTTYDYKPVNDKCFELVNNYKVWITTVGQNKKPSILICRPNDNVYEKVGMLSKPELFLEMLRGG